jgi:hypothetical protein
MWVGSLLTSTLGDGSMTGELGTVANGRATGKHMTQPSRALAFVANDRYYDWTLIFLESLRRQNATLPLYCIPFDEQHARVRSLRHAFEFEMLEVEKSPFDDFIDEFRWSRFTLDTLSQYGTFRRFLALELDYDEVAYFDVDTALLVDPDRLFGHVSTGRADLVYLATTESRTYRRDRMSLARQHFPDMRLFSCGAFVTSRNVLSIPLIMETVRSNLELYRALAPKEPPICDQTVLNFVVHSKRMKYRHIRECDESQIGMAWFRNRDLTLRDGRWGVGETDREFSAVHWAGGFKRATEWLTPRLRPVGQLRRDLLRDAKERVTISGSRQKLTPAPVAPLPNEEAVETGR